jgi:hypothetical protein
MDSGWVNSFESAVKYPNPNHNPCSFNINCKLCATDEKSRFWFKVDHCFMTKRKRKTISIKYHPQN